MRDVVTPNELYRVLRALLGLPDNCVSFELRAVAGQYGATVTCEHYVALDAPGLTQLESVLSAYELVHKPAAEAERADEAGAGFRVVDFDAWMHDRTERAHVEFMTRTARLPA